MKNKSFIKRVYSFLKSTFLSGLFAILPIAITIFLLTFSYNLIAKWLLPLRNVLPIMLQQVPGSEFILSILGLMFLGLMTKLFIIAPILHWSERLIKQIPIVNTIYSGAKTLVNFFNIPDPAGAERKVVLIRYPKNEYYNIAFVLGSASNSFESLIPEGMKKPEEEYFKVFMPNTPNPSSGYFFILPKSEIVETNISFEEAIKTVVSCGLITPESLT